MKQSLRMMVLRVRMPCWDDLGAWTRGQQWIGFLRIVGHLPYFYDMLRNTVPENFTY
ncbi:MAG: hypothetical protein IPI24_03250 [Ignavibacteria bacterium]|nr:hypothetical protein [Ignavibacteria bacterium]